MDGIVTDLQRFSIHDGPGIRTTVFLKGCPLRCLWCSNPETQRFEIERLDGVAGGAGRVVGRKMTAAEVARETLRDRVFYEKSGGGVTLSGGEAAAQPEFAAEILRLLKAEGIHTAVETCGYGDWEKLWSVLERADLVLFDVKHTDDRLHRRFTGVSNASILDNLARLSKRGKEILIRMPAVPGHNLDADTFRAVLELARENGVSAVEFLPYHGLGESKYRGLAREYALAGTPMQSAEDVGEVLARVAAPEGVRVVGDQ